ncbi:MAG: DNA replication/repair protein RecF [Armatimonadetes bacterium]|nr:DNA replication/repair protein RecF [Armatimonadota bacterium]CUU35871.1 DNA replication and repair protein RecF [Armatimonadetes bacterium DC]
MRLNALRLWNFRNFAEAELYPDPHMNVLVGANAQGKTNLLEALYYLSTLKPLRPVKESDLIRWGASEARLFARFTRDEFEDTVHIRLIAGGKRTILLNEQPLTRQSAFVGTLMVVCFSSQDLQIVRGEPADRRRFLDTELSLLSHRYLYSLAQYRRVLEQRNNLLRAHAEGTATLESLPEWNTQLVKYGARLCQMRRQFLERLNFAAQNVHQALTGGNESIELTYLPGIPLPTQGYMPEKEEDWASAFASALREREAEEIQRGTTLVGPHRDDFLIRVGGVEARQFASQGQQRTCALSLRLSEVPLLESLREEPPIVLLDDVFSDLDPYRRARLVAFLHPRVQTFITCTDLSMFEPHVLEASALFVVEQGRVRRDG